MSRKPTDTKERILDTATHLFSTHGFAGTAVDDILTAVGITKGAFYHYFKSKDNLCESVLDAAISQYHQLAESFQTEMTSPDALYRWLTALIEKQTSGQWLHCRLITRLSIESAELNASIQNKLRTFWQWCQSLYETLIRRAIQDKPRDKPIDPSAMARLFIAAHFGALWLDRCAPAKEDVVTVCETLLRQISE
ncbi:MAG: TetR/AcrR family transcriptional regulator [Planctomycetes bacterium]|nr:TetR/AcrR family transcriptional regulator [Planctomycetota bacterium]